MLLTNRIHFIWAAILIFCCSCENHDMVKTIDFKKFTIEAPSTWHKFKLWIEDSYVGGIKLDSGDEITFDLGLYSNSLGDIDSLTHNFEIITIDGRMAKLVTPRNSGHGTVAVYIDSLWVKANFGDYYMVDRFVIVGNDLRPENEKKLISAFRTIKFKKD
jgi:hypothetical protein